MLSDVKTVNCLKGNIIKLYEGSANEKSSYGKQNKSVIYMPW